VIHFLWSEATKTSKIYGRSNRFTTRAKVCCSRGFFCSTIMCNCISKQIPLKQWDIWNLNISHTLPIVHQIITCLDNKKKPRMDDYLPVIMKLRTQCICGLDHKWQLSSKMVSEGLWTTTQSVMEEAVIMLRNDIQGLSEKYPTFGREKYIT